jgi:hypothetical protein
LERNERNGGRGENDTWERGEEDRQDGEEQIRRTHSLGREGRDGIGKGCDKEGGWDLVVECKMEISRVEALKGFKSKVEKEIRAMREKSGETKAAARAGGSACDSPIFRGSNDGEYDDRNI